MKELPLIILSFILLTSCAGGGGTTTGNPVKTVNVRMQDQQPFSWIKKISDSIVPSAYANVSNLSLCFKRLRFKPVENDSTGAENIDLELGLVSINPSGTNLISVSVPEGEYRRIEFDLEDGCDGNNSTPSVTFINNQGTFSTSDKMTIKFDGVFIVDADKNLDLNIDAILDEMETVTLSSTIKSQLESVTGDF